jgi:hypothetical protein
MDAPPIVAASPSAPVTGLGLPGAVGMGGGDSCGSLPKLKNWPRAIAWSEFKEVEARPAGEHEDAQIEAQAILDPEVKICRDAGKLRLGAFTVKVIVYEENSWVVKGTKTDELKSHEQGHYDLAGLEARALMNRLAALRVDSADQLQREVTEQIEASNTSSQALSDLYDDETDHGRKTVEQARWKAAIQDAIDTGKEFKVPG